MDAEIQRVLDRIERSGRNIRDFMPVTQEDRDRMGVKRQEALRKIRILCIVRIFIALGAIILGIVVLPRASNPLYKYPHNMPGGLIAGAVSVISCILGICAFYEGKKYPTGDETGTCFRCLLGFLVFTDFVAGMASVLASFAFAGVWALADCSKYRGPNRTDRLFDSLYTCEDDRDALRTTAIFHIIFGLSLLICALVSSCFYCCNSRAFGIKSRIEVLMDLQSARNLEALRQQQRLTPNIPLVPMQGTAYTAQGYASQQEGMGTTPAGQPGPIMIGGQLYYPAPGPQIPSAPPANAQMSHFTNEDRYRPREDAGHDQYDLSMPPPSYADVTSRV